MKTLKVLSSLFVMALFAISLAGSGEDSASNSNSSNSNENSQQIDSEETEQASFEAMIAESLSYYYNDFSKLISVEKLPSDSDYDYRFTIEEKIGYGMTCKQKGFIKCYSDGTVSNVISYGDPFDFRDNKGNEVHDKTGNNLY